MRTVTMVLAMAFSRLLFADMYSAQGHKLDIPTPKGYIVAPDKLRKAFDDGRVKAGGNNDRRFVLFARQASIDSTGLIGDTLSLSLFPYADKVYTDNEFAALKNKMLANSKAAAASLPVGVEFKWSKDRGSWIMSMLMAPLNVVGGPSSIKTCEITGSVLIGNHVYYYSSQSIYMSDEELTKRVEEVETWLRLMTDPHADDGHGAKQCVGTGSNMHTVLAEQNDLGKVFDTNGNVRQILGFVFGSSNETAKCQGGLLAKPFRKFETYSLKYGEEFGDLYEVRLSSRRIHLNNDGIEPWDSEQDLIATILWPFCNSGQKVRC